MPWDMFIKNQNNMIRTVTYEERDGYLWEIENIDGAIKMIQLSKVEMPKNKKNKVEEEKAE